MKFCVNCGNALRQRQKFCSKCGKKLVEIDNNSIEARQVLEDDKIAEPSQTTAETSGQNNDRNNAENQITAINTYNTVSQYSGQVQNNLLAKAKKDKKPMSKVAKVAIMVLAVLLVLGSAGFGIGLSLTSEKKVVKNIKKAIEEKNSKELAKYLYCSKKDIEIDEKEAASLIEFLNEDEKYKKELFLRLENGSSYDSFDVKRNGKTLVIFNRYMMEVEPQYLELAANYEDIAIKLEGKSIGKLESSNKAKKFGPFLPGKYILEYIYENDYEPIVVKKEIRLTKGKLEDKVKFNIHEIVVESYIDKVKVSFDGKEVKEEISRSNNRIGPFSFDKAGVLVFSKDYSWGKIKTEEFNTDVYSIYVDAFIMKDSDFIKSAAPTIKEFVNSYYDAKSSNDAKKLVNATENCKNTFSNEFFYENSNTSTFKKVSVDLGKLLVAFDEETEKDIFEVRVAAEYIKNNGQTSTEENTEENSEEDREENTEEDTENSKEDKGIKETLNLYMFYDESNKKWMVNNYNSIGWVSDDLMEIK